MADVNANIGVNIDTSNALAQIKGLQRQLSEFYTSISRSSETAALAQRDLQRNLVNSVNSLGGFSAELRTIKTTAESFTNSLEKNKFSMREYFRYAAASTKTFSRLFASEFDTINKVAEENVKRLQTQYIKLGRDSSGAMKAIAVIPTQLNMEDLAVKTQMAAQRQALFNQLLKQGSTNLLNFGKNTQWAGRQLMVGFTIPLSIFGNTAAKAFMEMETAALKFKKVYGDLGTTQDEANKALQGIQDLAAGFTKYGIAASQTVQLAADAAAAGFQGVDLQRQTTAATRLAVLGQVDQQKALETTIALQNAFKMSSDDLASSIDFLNAVENQTVTSLDDITTAIPKAAPVVEQLGGNVKDLAFFLTAMKEGGINASEGANALKSGLASIINPTKRASDMLAGMGINIKNIVEKNRGNLKATVIEFASALNQLAPLERARAIEQMFGKFQFARLSTLFQNVTRDGTQAARVLNLAGASVEDLALLSEKELGMTADSAMNKFKKSIEDLKIALVPVGQVFLETATPIINFVGDLLDKFNNLSPGVKKVLSIITIGLGAIGPVALMAFGLLANGFANIIKFVSILRNGYLRLTGQSKVLGEQTQFLTVEQQNAAAVAHSLEQSHARLTQTFNVESRALSGLTSAYTRAAAAAGSFLLNNPGMVLPGRMPKRYADGVSIVPGTGSTDSVPAMLTPGEAVIPKAMTKKYGALINGMIADNIPGYRKGLGTGTAVDIPGGFAAAHFGGSAYRSGAELIAMVENMDTAFARAVRKMVAEVEGGLDRVFTVFSNEVIGTSTELNRAVGKTGSGKKADINLARRDLIDRGDVRDIELQRQLQNAGVSIDEIKRINKRITDEIKNGFTKLGDKTEVTAEDLDKLINDAYNAVAKTDARVAAAQQRMKDITAVTDPRNDSRIALSKDPYTKFRKSGKYYQGMEEMVGPSNVPYQKNARFKITNEMAAAIGLSSGNAADVYNKLSQQAQITLAKLRTDITKFSLEFEKQAEIAGLKIGNSYKIGVDKSGLKDIYVETRQRQSPHPLAPKDGMDDGNAYETARQNAVRTRRAASSPGGTVGPGGVIIPPMPPVGGGGAGGGDMYGPRRPTFYDRTLGRVGGRLGVFGANLAGGKFAGAGMAASTAVFAASMMPGKMGELASKISPLIYGFQALQMVLKFLPGPWKAFTIGIGITVGLIKLVNAARERERQAIEGLADAATLTKDKLKTLGDFFGVTPTKSPFQTDLPQLTLAPQQRTQVQQLKESEGFQKTYAKDISALKKASNKEAELIFKSLSTNLAGQGFATEQIQTIIDALREEAGKTDVKLDVKSLNLKTKEGQESLKKSVDDVITNVQTAFKNGFEKKQVLVAGQGPQGQYYSQYVEQLVPTKELQKQTKAAAAEISGFISGISGQLANGTIGAKEFNQSFGNIEATLKAMNASNPAAAVMLMSNIMATLPEKARKAAEGVKSLDGQMLLLKMQALGLTSNLAGVADALKILQNPLSDVSDRVKAQKTVDDAIKQTIEYSKKLEEALKKAMGGGLTGGNTANSAFANLKKQLLENIANTKNGITAFNKMRESGIGISEALELSKDPLIAMVLATEKNKTRFNEILSLIKQMNTEAEKDVLKRYLEGLKGSNELKKNFLEIMPTLEKLGLKSDEIMKLLESPDIAKGLINGLNQAKDKAAFLKDYIDQIVQERTLNIKINLSTVQGKVEAVQGAAGAAIKSIDARAAVIRRAAQTGSYGGDFAKLSGLNADQLKAISGINLKARQDAVNTAKQNVANQQKVVAGIQAGINAKQHDMDINNQLIAQQQDFINGIDKQIKQQQDLITQKEKYVDINFDKPLQALQNESNVLSNTLSQIEHAEKAINQQYDLRIQALDEQQKALDNQQKAMEEMNRLNQESIQQGKTKISIADALTQGDISAAAQAIQDLRAQQAAAQSGSLQNALDASRSALDNSRNQLEANRKQEIENITINGMKRAQIEERQYQIQQDSFKLEQAKASYIEQNILPLQTKIAELEASKIPYQEKINELTTINDGIQKSIEATQTGQLYNAEQTLNTLNDQVDAAQAKLDADEASLAAIIASLTESGKTKDEWEAIVEAAETAQAKFEAIQNSLLSAANSAAAIKSILDDINGQVYTVTIVQNTVAGTSTGTNMGANQRGEYSNTGTGTVTGTKIVDGRTVVTSLGSDTGIVVAPSTPRQYVAPRGALQEEALTFGGRVLKKAVGGIIPGNGLLDKIPALLTPGEFVVNKQATKTFGPMLESINQMQYPDMSGRDNVKVNNARVLSVNDNSSEVYNYKVDVNVNGTNADPDSIANAVLYKIKEMENRSIRRRGI